MVKTHEKKLKIIGNLLDTLYYILTIILLFFHPYVDTIIYYSNYLIELLKKVLL